jgi:hypothetical protein
MARRFEEGLNAKQAGVKVGDRFRVINDRHDGATVDEIVWLVQDDNTKYPYFSRTGKGGEADLCLRFEDLELIEEGIDMEENSTPAEYVRVERNTELFKKGAVFKLNSSYSRKLYDPINKDEALIDGSHLVEGRIGVETVARLPKVFVPVQKFNPEYVTAEENERLQAVLTKKTVKKAKK